MSVSLGRQTSGVATLPKRTHIDAALPVVTGIFIFALVTPLVISIGPIALNFARLILLLAFLPCLYLLLSGKRGPLMWTDFFFFAFVFWFGVSMFYHHGATQIERIGQNMVNSFGAYLLARTTITNAKQFRTMVNLFAIAAALVVPWALIEAFTGRVLLNELLGRIPLWLTFNHVDGPPRLGLDRAQGTFEHPILYGVFSSSLLILCVMVRESKIWALFALIGGFLSLSTAALLQIVLQLFFLSWNAALRTVRSRWKILVVCVAVAYFFVDLISNRSPLRVFISYATFNMGTGFHRIHIWNYGSQNIIDNPIFGLGLNDWKRPSWLYSSSIDNFWLVVAMWTGFPGVIAMISGIAIAIYKALRRKISYGSMVARYRTAWVITILTVCISISTVHIWNATYSFFFFLVGAGLWFAQVREADELSEGANAKDVQTTDQGRRSSYYTRFPVRSHDSRTNTSGNVGAPSQPLASTSWPRMSPATRKISHVSEESAFLRPLDRCE